MSASATATSQAPYLCINPLTNLPCTNYSECCTTGYEFNTDVQQCLCKYLKSFCVKINIIHSICFSYLVRSVCNSTICGAGGVCQDSEIKANGYICTCSSNEIFDGTTCVRMYFLIVKYIQEIIISYVI